MRDPLHWLDVKRKLALTFVGVCLLAFGVGGSLAATSASAALEEEILLRLRFQCRTWSDALDSDLRLLTRRCEDFASDGYIRERVARALGQPGEDADRAREDVRRHLANNKRPLVAAFSELAVLDESGRVVVSAVTPAPPRVDDVAAGVARSSDAPWHSGLLGAAGTGAAPLQTIAVPLRSLDGTRHLGHLVAWVRTDAWIASALGGLEAGENPRAATVALSLVDAAGREVSVPSVLLGAQAADVGEQARRGLVLRDVAADDPGAYDAGGLGSTSVRVPLAANGWNVRVRLTSPDALAPVSGLQARFLLVGVALATAIGLILFFPMRFLARPLVELREAARRLQGGDLDARVEPASEDEIGDLARSFNHMADAVATRTRRLEDAAREFAAQRDKLDAVIASMRDGLVVIDAGGRPVLSNASAKPLLDLVAAGDARITSHYRCEDAKAPGTDCVTCLLAPRRPVRTCVVDADGKVLEIRATALPPGRDGRQGRVLVARDITGRIEQDEREIHHERLSVLGEVAAVMAHELNNPLAAISMFSQMVEQGLGPDTPWSEHLQVIRRNTDNCKRAIRELLDYATGSAPEVGEVDLHETLRDVARFVRPLSERSNARIALRLDAPAPCVSGDEIQLRQVFVNLVVNALQAMGRQGGEVALATRNEGGHVVVDVTDTGPGIPAEVRSRIFDPFFTTKPRGMGTGLGLPTARRIAELHGGGIDVVASAPGRTVFRVRLRCVAADDGRREQPEPGCATAASVRLAATGGGAA